MGAYNFIYPELLAALHEYRRPLRMPISTAICQLLAENPKLAPMLNQSAKPDEKPRTYRVHRRNKLGAFEIINVTEDRLTPDERAKAGLPSAQPDVVDLTEPTRTVTRLVEGPRGQKPKPVTMQVPESQLRPDERRRLGVQAAAPAPQPSPAPQPAPEFDRELAAEAFNAGGLILGNMEDCNIGPTDADAQLAQIEAWGPSARRAVAFYRRRIEEWKSREPEPPED